MPESAHRILRITHKQRCKLAEGTLPETNADNDIWVGETYDPSVLPENSFSFDPNWTLIEPVHILTTTGQRFNRLLSGETHRRTYKVYFEKMPLQSDSPC